MVLHEIVTNYSAQHQSTRHCEVRPLLRNGKPREPKEPQCRIEARSFVARSSQPEDPALKRLLEQRRELDEKIEARRTELRRAREAKQAAMSTRQAEIEAEVARNRVHRIGHDLARSGAAVQVPKG